MRMLNLCVESILFRFLLWRSGLVELRNLVQRDIFYSDWAAKMCQLSEMGIRKIWIPFPVRFLTSYYLFFKLQYNPLSFTTLLNYSDTHEILEDSWHALDNQIIIDQLKTVKVLRKIPELIGSFMLAGLHQILSVNIQIRIKNTNGTQEICTALLFFIR